MCVSPTVATRLPPNTGSHEAVPPSEARANTKARLSQARRHAPARRQTRAQRLTSLSVERSATGSVLVLVRRVERPFRVDRGDRPRGGRHLSLRCRPGEQQPVADGQEHVVESFVFLDPAGEVEYASGRLVVGGGWEGGAVAE